MIAKLKSIIAISGSRSSRFLSFIALSFSGFILLFQNCSSTAGFQVQSSAVASVGICQSNSADAACAKACFFNGQTIPNGSSITLYFKNSDSVCASEVRSCTNGSLSGSAMFSSCQLVQPSPMSLNAPVKQSISSSNRVYHSGGLMAGAWGNQLRGLMRNSADRLFYVEDSGPSVYSNTGLGYYGKNPDGSWSLVGSQTQLPGIQQNTASIILQNRYIYSYGVDVSSTHYLEECYFDTLNPASKACNAITISGVPFSVQVGSNYVGAAVDLDGVSRVVWWTTVGANGAPGTWNYIYNFGGGWNGPVIGGLSGYNDFEYVYGTLRNQRFVGAGQLLLGDYTSTYSYQGAVVDFQLGQQPQLHLLNPDSPSYTAGMRIWSGGDVFIEPKSGSIHILANEAVGSGSSPADYLSGKIAYYFVPGGQSIPSSLSATSYINNAYRPRFQSNGTFDSIVVPRLAGGSSMLDVYRKSSTTSGGKPFDLSEASRIEAVPYDSKTGNTDTVFVESPQYQTLMPKGLEIGVLGSWSANTDHLVINFSF